MDDGPPSAPRGLAANPSAPLDVLLRLVPAPEVAAHLALVRTGIPDVPANRLLDTGDRTTTLLLASARKRSPAVLERIAQHPAAAENVRTTVEYAITHHGSPKPCCSTTIRTSSKPPRPCQKP